MTASEVAKVMIRWLILNICPQQEPQREAASCPEDIGSRDLAPRGDCRSRIWRAFGGQVARWRLLSIALGYAHHSHSIVPEVPLGFYFRMVA